MSKRSNKDRKYPALNALGWAAAKQLSSNVTEIQPSSSSGVSVEYETNDSWDKSDEFYRCREEKFQSSQVRADDNIVNVDINIRMARTEPSVIMCPLPTASTFEEDEVFRRNYITKLRFENFPPKRLISRREARNIYRKYCDMLCSNIKFTPMTNNFVHFIIGPMACKNIESRHKKRHFKDVQPGRFRFKPNILGFLERDCYCLLNSANKTIVFLIEKHLASEKKLKNSVVDVFGLANVIRKTFDFSLPNIPHGISIFYQTEPDLLENSKRFNYIAFHVGVDISCSHKAYFEDKLTNNIEVRPMKLVENKLFNVKNGTLFPRKTSYIIKFDNYMDKLDVLRRYDSCSKEWNLVDGSIGPASSYECLSILIIYNTKKTLSKYVTLKIRNPCELHFTEKVLTMHNLRVDFKGHNGEISYEGKYIHGNDTILVSSFPCFVNSITYIKWFLNRILSANNIDYISINFGRDTFNNNRHDIDPLIKHMLSKSPESKVHRQLVSILQSIEHSDDISADDFGEDFENAVPWIHEPSKPVYENFDDDLGKMQQSIRFFGSDVQIGHMIAYRLLEKVNENTNLFLFSGFDYYGPQIVPKYRKLYPITKNIRISVDDQIVQLDTEMRELMREYEISGNECMTRKYSDKVYLRIVEESDNESEALIGLEGWDPRVVNEYIPKLLKLFEPIVVDCLEMPMERLLYGIGEAFVRNLVNLYDGKVVVEFDRFRRKIYVFGSMGEQFVEEISDFENSIERISIAVDIPVTAPYFNDELRANIKREHIQRLEEDLGAEIRTDKKDHSIHFEGSVSAYNVLIKILTMLNQEIFKKNTYLLRDEMDYSRCPICHDNISSDFYRLEECGHVYCRTCLNSYLLHSINGYALPCKCLFRNCLYSVIPLDIKRLILGGSDRVRLMDSEKLQTIFNQSLSQVIVRSNGRYRSCSVPDCVGLLCINKFEEHVKCSKCLKLFCGKCLEEPHENMSCEEYRRVRLDVEASVEAYQNASKNVQRCPNKTCGAVIEKEEGCDHIHCSFCQTHFCWKCLFQASDKALIYAHMNDVHGNFGGGWEIDGDVILQAPEEDFVLDRMIQNILLQPR